MALKHQRDCNPKHTYLEASPIELGGAYLENVFSGLGYNEGITLGIFFKEMVLFPYSLLLHTSKV